MADYSYNNGDGLTALEITTPNGAIEPVSIVDDAIRQIKAYLKDPDAGPEALISALLPPGFLQMFAGSSIPTGYLLCNGSAVSRTTYSALFVVLGTTYGSGNGTTTFNLPDFRGRVPSGVGTGDSTDATSWALAQKRGTEGVSLSTAELASHTHSVAGSDVSSTLLTTGDQNVSSKQLNADSDNFDYTLGATTATPTLGKVGTAGSGAAHNNIQPSLGINFYVKY